MIVTKMFNIICYTAFGFRLKVKFRISELVQASFTFNNIIII